MKIPASIREVYEDQLPRYERLQKVVADKLLAQKASGWHFEHRVKGPESFALKLESGRFHDPRQLEDFFACTLVVQNLTEVKKAYTLIDGLFSIRYRRPFSDDETVKPPDAFRFDDLRLYVAWRDDDALPPTGLSGVVFEVQIKTFLQHAWGIATHDLVYKTDAVSWPKERIAYQIKAMLEHAELSIQEAISLSSSATLPRYSKKSEELAKTIIFLKELWAPSDLPKDLRRLAQNIIDLSEALQLDKDAIFNFVRSETAAGRGAQILNLSPYLIMLQSTLSCSPAAVAAFIENDQTKFKVLLPEEVSIAGPISDTLSGAGKCIRLP